MMCCVSPRSMNSRARLWMTELPFTYVNTSLSLHQSQSLIIDTCHTKHACACTVYVDIRAPINIVAALFVEWHVLFRALEVAIGTVPFRPAGHHSQKPARQPATLVLRVSSEGANVPHRLPLRVLPPLVVPRAILLESHEPLHHLLAGQLPVHENRGLHRSRQRKVISVTAGLHDCPVLERPRVERSARSCRDLTPILANDSHL
mmetsp:Transcript_34935/g.78740  ORF Transcript_34935/g.78740 Transcript_34935/m.78740 type:complete len:204 (+) Transcript_34935:84-695(+)